MTGINRQPAGVLGFLGIKNFGRNPETLGNTLAPVWDYTDFYLEAAAQISQISGTWDAAGTLGIFTPPAGEVWFVSHFGLRTDVIGGRTVNGVLTVSKTNGIGVVPLSQNGASATTATDRVTLAMNRPIILQPGEELGAFVNHFVGAAGLVVNYAVRYTPMTV